MSKEGDVQWKGKKENINYCLNIERTSQPYDLIGGIKTLSPVVTLLRLLTLAGFINK